MPTWADRALPRIAATLGGVASIYAGVAVKGPPEYLGDDPWGHLGTSLASEVIGWSLIVLGVIVVLAVIASVAPLSRAGDPKVRSRRPVEAPTLPEARARGRPPADGKRAAPRSPGRWLGRR